MSPGFDQGTVTGVLHQPGAAKTMGEKCRGHEGIPMAHNQETFLGLAGYYRHFVPNFSSLASPLSDLTKNGQPSKVHLTVEVEQAFQALKHGLTSSPVLRNPDFTAPSLYILMPLIQAWVQCYHKISMERNTPLSS